VKRFLGFVAILLGAGGVLWYLGFRPSNPLASRAEGLSLSGGTESIRAIVTDLDHSVAQVIRQTTEDGISWPSVGSWSAVNLKDATISANISTSPDELWQTFREEGSRAVVESLANSAEMSVNNVSTQVMNEARYQYCVGVVEQYEKQLSPSN